MDINCPQHIPQKIDIADAAAAMQRFEARIAALEAETPHSNSKLKGTSMSRPPLPPFDGETAAQKARAAEDAWNSRDPARVALAYTPRASGAIAPSFWSAARPSCPFSRANGA